MRWDVLIVGGGMAAGRLVRKLGELGYRGSVCLICDEPQAGYNRVLLPHLLAGQCAEEDLHHEDWPDELHLSVLTSRRVVRVELRQRLVILQDGTTIDFDHLVFATGSRVPKPDVLGVDLPHVAQMRSFADVGRVRKIARRSRHAIVVGGGALGLETADALQQLGVSVHIIHRGPHLMHRQADQLAGAELAHEFRCRGVTVSLDTSVMEIVSDRTYPHVTLGDGTKCLADLVVFATGTRPADELANAAGLVCDAGVTTDSFLQASQPKVYAVGECARVTGQCYSLVGPVFRQADALAQTLSGTPTSFSPPALSTRLKVSGMALFSAGKIDADPVPGSDDVWVDDRLRGVYRRLLFKGSKLIGVVLLGDTTGSHKLTRRIGTSVSDEDCERLAFGLA